MIQYMCLSHRVWVFATAFKSKWFFLRLAYISDLLVPKYLLRSSWQDRACAAPRIWNDPSEEIRSADSAISLLKYVSSFLVVLLAILLSNVLYEHSYYFPNHVSKSYVGILNSVGQILWLWATKEDYTRLNESILPLQPLAEEFCGRTWPGCLFRRGVVRRWKAVETMTSWHDCLDVNNIFLKAEQLLR